MAADLYFSDRLLGPLISAQAHTSEPVCKRGTVEFRGLLLRFLLLFLRDLVPDPFCRAPYQVHVD